MTAETDFSPKSVDTTCLAVGRFFFHWAFLESSIDAVIAKLFKLPALEGLIFSANIQFSSKLHIINTALQWQGRFHDENWRKRARKLILRIGRLNKSRNLMAHNLFAPLKNGGVKFHKVEAKGELAFPRVHWSQTDFCRTYNLIKAADTELGTLTAELDMQQALFAVLAKNPTQPPIGGTGWRGLLGHLLHQPPTPPDSREGSTTQETSPQTHQEPEKK